MNFSEKLIDLRKAKKLTQSDAARQAGMPLRSYQRYEHGEQEPTLSKLVLLADVFDVSLDELVGRAMSQETISRDTEDTANTEASVFQITMDEDLKEQATELYADLGLDLSTAIELFLRQSVREQRIPFDIRRNQPNAETIQAIDNVQNDVNLSRAFHSVEELMADLNSEEEETV